MEQCNGMLSLKDIVIDDEFKNFLPAVEDPSLLRAKIDTEGWTDEPITVWQHHCILLDGHRRYAIWQERGEDDGPQIRELKFETREAAFYWVVTHQRSRRNLTPEQERYLLGRRYTAEKGMQAGAPKGNQNASKKQYPENHGIDSGVSKHETSTAGKLGKSIGASEQKVIHAEKYANAVDDLDARGVVSKADVLSGAIKVPAKRLVEAANAESVEQAQEMIATATKGGTRKNKNDGASEPTKQPEGEPNGAESGTDKQRAIAVSAIHEVIDYLKRSKLMELGVKNPHRDYAYDRVIGWLKSNKKSKQHV